MKLVKITSPLAEIEPRTIGVAGKHAYNCATMADQYIFIFFIKKLLCIIIINMNTVNYYIFIRKFFI